MPRTRIPKQPKSAVDKVTSRITFRLPIMLKAKLMQQAEAEGRTLNELIREVLSDKF